MKLFRKFRSITRHPNENVDLIQFLNRFFHPLGVDLKYQFDRRFLNATLVIMAITYLDFIYGILIAFIPIRYDQLLMKMGDVGLYLFGPKFRHFSTFINIFYRLQAIGLLTNYNVDSHTWLQNANAHYHNVPNIRISSQMIQKVKMYRTTVVFNLFVLWGLALLGLTVLMNLNHSYYAKYNMVYGFFYLAWFVGIYGYYAWMFIVEYYMLCKLSISFYEQANMSLLETLKHSPTVDTVTNSFWQFSQVYLTVSFVQNYLKRVYLIVCLCNFAMITVIFYVAFYTKVSPQLTVLHGMIGSDFVCVILFFSFWVGRINSEASALSDTVYYYINIKQKNNLLSNNKVIYEVFEFSQNRQQKLKKKSFFLDDELRRMCPRKHSWNRNPRQHNQHENNDHCK